MATELHVYPGAPHGLGLFPTSTLATRWTRDEEWLAGQLRVGLP